MCENRCVAHRAHQSMAAKIVQNTDFLVKIKQWRDVLQDVFCLKIVVPITQFCVIGVGYVQSWPKESSYVLLKACMANENLE